MKSFINLLVLLLFFNLSVKSQITVVEKLSNGQVIHVNLNEKEDVHMVQVVGLSNFWGTKVTVSVDYGQKHDLRNDSYIIREDGSQIKFFSMIQALNYFLEHGWEYVDANIITISNQNVYHYKMKKTGS